MPSLLIPPPGWIDPHDWTANFTPPGIQSFVIAAPSGDRTGNTDTATINNLLANEQYVMLGPGTFFQNAPYLITNSAQMFVGSGENVTTLTFTGSNPATAQIDVGPSSLVQNITIRDMQTFGNASSGHAIRWRAKASNIQNMTLQSCQSDGLHQDANTIGASNNNNYFANLNVIHPGNDGFYQDVKAFDSGFFNCQCDGGTSGDTAVGGNYGFEITGGNNNWFFGCHPYLFASGGVFLAGDKNCFYGGEMESNGVADLVVTNAHLCTIHGVAFYDHANPVPPTQHILFTGTNSGQIDISGCSKKADTFAVANFYTISNSSANIRIHECPGVTPFGNQTPPTYTGGSATTNPFPFDCRVFVAGATAVAINGTATGLGAGSYTVCAGDTITPTGAGSWTWFGV